MVGDAQRGRGVLFDEQHGETGGVAEIVDRVHQLRRDEGGEAERRLVEQEDRGSRDEGPGHCQHLALAAGELGGVLTAALPEHRESLELLGEPLGEIRLGRQRAEA